MCLLATGLHSLARPLWGAPGAPWRRIGGPRAGSRPRGCKRVRSAGWRCVAAHAVCNGGAACAQQRRGTYPAAAKGEPCLVQTVAKKSCALGSGKRVLLTLGSLQPSRSGKALVRSAACRREAVIALLMAWACLMHHSLGHAFFVLADAQLSFCSLLWHYMGRAEVSLRPATAKRQITASYGTITLFLQHFMRFESLSDEATRLHSERKAASFHCRISSRQGLQN